jgi:translation initiation factor IF-2
VFSIPIIIKADTHGSIEAIEYELKKIKLNNAEIQVVSAGTGNITEADIKTASGNENTVVVGFGIDVDRQAEIMRDRLNIKLATFKIIYELVDWLKKITEEIRPLVEVEEILGQAKILRTFSETTKVKVCGGRMEQGKLKLGTDVRILRRGEKIGQGKIKELQMQKAKVDEVPEGSEFGIAIETKIEIAQGDYIEAFQIVKK